MSFYLPRNYKLRCFFYDPIYNNMELDSGELKLFHLLIQTDSILKYLLVVSYIPLD